MWDKETQADTYHMCTTSEFLINTPVFLLQLEVSNGRSQSRLGKPVLVSYPLVKAVYADLYKKHRYGKQNKTKQNKTKTVQKWEQLWPKLYLKTFQNKTKVFRCSHNCWRENYTTYLLNASCRWKNKQNSPVYLDD